MEFKRDVPSIYDLAVPITTQLPDESPDIISGLIPKDDLVVIVGPTNIGKTLLALEICSALVTGNTLWGSLKPEVKARKILYVLGEHRTRKLLDLSRKTRLELNEDILVLGPEKLGMNKYLISGGRQNVDNINMFRKWSEGMDFIVFDPLASFIVGVDSENDNSVMRLLIETVNSISMTSGASCLLLGHMGKPSVDYVSGREFHRASYALRGASGSEDAATNIFYLQQSESNAKQGDGKLYDLIQRKYKGDAPERYRLLRDPDTLTHTLLGNRGAYQDVQKAQLLSKIHRLQIAQPQMEYRTCIKLISAAEGLSEETVKRQIGLVS